MFTHSSRPLPRWCFVKSDASRSFLQVPYAIWPDFPTFYIGYQSHSYEVNWTSVFVTVAAVRRRQYKDITAAVKKLAIACEGRQLPSSVSLGVILSNHLCRDAWKYYFLRDLLLASQSGDVQEDRKLSLNLKINQNQHWGSLRGS